MWVLESPKYLTLILIIIAFILCLLLSVSEASGHVLFPEERETHRETEKENEPRSHCEASVPSCEWDWKIEVYQSLPALFQGLGDEAFPQEWSARKWHSFIDVILLAKKESVDFREHFITDHFNHKLPKWQPK